MSIDRLQEKIRKLKNPSVVDFDILPEHIPPQLKQQEGSFQRAYSRFCMELMDALRDTVPAVRFNFGAFAILDTEGLTALARVLDHAKKLGFYVLLDVPEALSANRAEANAQILFEEGCMWPCDGMVLSSYIGSDGIKPYAARLKDSDKDLFVVLRTGNKSGPELQDLMTGGRLVHQAQADITNRFSETLPARCGYNRIGGMAAASSLSGLQTLRAKYKNMFLLLDGYDYPNANAKNCSFAFDRLGHGAAACGGTSITGAWLLNESDGTEYVREAFEAADRMKKNLTRYVTIL